MRERKLNSADSSENKQVGNSIGTGASLQITVWPTGVDRYEAIGQLRDKGHREHGEAEL